MFFKPGLLENKLYLVVDDFGDMRSMIKNMLVACGAREIRLARNGADAIEQIEEQRFDVVLCDYNLGPGRDGQQVLEEAKQRKLLALGSVFVMVTAENTRDMVMGAVEYEPDSYLTKPFSKDFLKTRLEKLIGKKQNLLPVEEAIAKHDYSQVVQILNKKIDDNPPNSNELKKILGEILLASGMTSKARVVYENALAIRDLPWARLGLGICLYEDQHYSDAITEFLKLKTEFPNYTPAYDWLAKSHKSLRQFNEAQEILKQAVSISPKAVLRQQMLGEIALYNQDDQTAEAAFSRAVNYGKHSIYKHPSNYANLAKVSAKNHEGAAGLDVLKKMARDFSHDPVADLYRVTAESLVHDSMKNQDLALEALNRAAAIYETIDHDKTSELSIEMAKTYMNFDMQEKSVKLLKDAVLNNHTDEHLMEEVKLTLTHLNIDEQTLGSIDSIREEVASLNRKGVELARNGQLEEAINLLRETSSRMPANKTVNLNISLVLLMIMDREGISQEKVDEIKSFLARVAKNDPDNSTLKKLYSRLKSMTIKAPE